MGRVDLTLPPNELWARLTAMPRPHVVVDFPRFDSRGEPIAQVALLVLTQAETMAANAASERKTRRLLKLDGGDVPSALDARQGYDDLFQSCAAVEVLFRCCKMPDDLKRPFFRVPEDLQIHLTVDEIGVLMAHYLELLRSVSPIRTIDGDEAFEAWCVRVVSGGTMSPLALLSLDSQSALVQFLMRKIWPSLSANMAPGAPADYGMSTDEIMPTAT